MNTLIRRPHVICLLICLLFFGRAAAAETSLKYDQLELADGRKLTSVVVKSYDAEADKILLMAGHTLMRVSLSQLPPALRDQIKQGAPRAGSSTSIMASAPPSPHHDPALASVQLAPIPPVAADLDATAHQRVAMDRAQNYYRYEFSAGSNAVRVTASNFEMDETEPVAGWTNRYRTGGRVYLQYFDSKGYSYSRTSDRFEILTEQKPGAAIKVIDFTRK